mmetsp:Transcript_22048/g.30631  ORF Transcript_22048/g.30631 Transcript_22048/m.30631 type:complete len:226 (+) Transcript_22048:160-837(+)|eukprot:CAMPEP_0196600368 /NCGR_PEP_ID=MMETSP1081-20130531/95350_1 /TAXON_ID=36882 /ORGANISM="Pyramimonas amylifera, Strain CCMP720" /LENGTH=225 /DNA_ID=CAMNT_0041926201 /DNA_START=502 /DNA_END=1179 /DNA_ORIENTATION=-
MEHSIVTFPPGPYFSIDVECVATGTGHNARAIAQIALVDQNCNCILNIFVKSPKPVTSYLTPLTGVTDEILGQYGLEADQALSLLRQYLPRSACLVGQNIGKDVHWLGLQESRDFASLVDLAGLWRVKNPRYDSFTYFGLDHVATCLLGASNDGRAHDAVQDAIKSISLFNLFNQLQMRPDDLARAQQQLLAMPIRPSFAASNPTFEGVCMGNRKTCICGDPFFG